MWFLAIESNCNIQRKLVSNKSLRSSDAFVTNLQTFSLNNKSRKQKQKIDNTLPGKLIKSPRSQFKKKIQQPEVNDDQRNVCPLEIES